MNDDLVSPSRTDLQAVEGGDDTTSNLEDEIQRLEGELLRCRKALELIRDRRFEQATSPRLIDQLWHFVRWSKSVAREALEGSRGNDRRRSRGK